MRTGSAYFAGKTSIPGPILKSCTAPLTVSKDLDAPASKDKQKQTRLTSMVLFDMLTLMNLTEYTLKKSKTNGAVRPDPFVKSSFPLWKIGYFFVPSKNLSKVALSCVFLSAFVLCQNSYAQVNLDALAERIIQAESSGRADVVGDGGKARGLMQIQEGTWKRHTSRPFSDAFDPTLNKAVGMAELRRIVKVYRSRGVEPSEAYVVWAYNTGSFIKRSLPKYDKTGKPHKWTWNHPNAIYRAIYREYLA